MPRSIRFWTLDSALSPYREGLLVPGLVRYAPCQKLSQFNLFTVLTILRRVLGVAVISHGMPTRPRMPQSGR
jgi:hypothetical protein